MTDASFPPDASAAAAPAAGASQEIDVDLAAFMPEGVELQAGPDRDTDTDADDEVADPTPDPRTAAAVDTEALSQIERDLDAVDAAIAALDAGTYGIDPAAGSPIDDPLLAETPTRLS